jgi:hypothetical protein
LAQDAADIGSLRLEISRNRGLHFFALDNPLPQRKLKRDFRIVKLQF